MRLAAILTTSSMLALGAALSPGCTAEGPSMLCDFVPMDGPPTVEAILRSADGTEWVDGGDVTLDLGGQGGYMVQPVIALEASALPAGSPDRICARVELDNVDPTGGDRFVGFETLTLELALRRNVITGRYETTTIFDQLRWTPLPPDTAFRLIAVVRTETVVASVTRDVLLQSSR